MLRQTKNTVTARYHDTGIGYGDLKCRLCTRELSDSVSFNLTQ